MRAAEKYRYTVRIRQGFAVLLKGACDIFSQRGTQSDNYLYSTALSTIVHYAEPAKAKIHDVQPLVEWYQFTLDGRFRAPVLVHPRIMDEKHEKPFAADKTCSSLLAGRTAASNWTQEADSKPKQWSRHADGGVSSSKPPGALSSLFDEYAWDYLEMRGFGGHERREELRRTGQSFTSERSQVSPQLQDAMLGLDKVDLKANPLRHSHWDTPKSWAQTDWQKPPDVKHLVDLLMAELSPAMQARAEKVFKGTTAENTNGRTALWEAYRDSGIEAARFFFNDRLGVRNEVLTPVNLLHSSKHNSSLATPDQRAVRSYASKQREREKASKKHADADSKTLTAADLGKSTAAPQIQPSLDARDADAAAADADADAGDAKAKATTDAGKSIKKTDVSQKPHKKGKKSRSKKPG